MNRIKIAVIAFTIFHILACKKELPATETIVIGSVIDENNKPMEGVTVKMVGINNKGLSGLATFDIKSKTDSHGVYKLSKNFPTETDDVLLQIINSDVINAGTDYDPYILVDGTYALLTIPYNLERANYCKTSIVNFKLKKR